MEDSHCVDGSDIGRRFRVESSNTGARFSTAALHATVFLRFACGHDVSFVFRAIDAVLAPYLVESSQLSVAQPGLLSSAYLVSFGLAQLPFGLARDPDSAPPVRHPGRCAGTYDHPGGREGLRRRGEPDHSRHAGVGVREEPASSPALATVPFEASIQK